MGYKSYYFLSAKYRIHPSYIQQMLNDKRYSSDDTLAVINLLTKLKEKRKYIILMF